MADRDRRAHVIFSVVFAQGQTLPAAIACSPTVPAALQGKSNLCIHFPGIVRPQSQFPHACVCERFIYSQDWSTYFPAAE
jgi:hypothetical protein